MLVVISCSNGSTVNFTGLRLNNDTSAAWYFFSCIVANKQLKRSG